MSEVSLVKYKELQENYKTAINLSFLKISYFPFYFQKSFFDILHKLIILNYLHLVTNKKNLKPEIRLTILHEILFFKNYKLLFLKNVFGNYFSRFRNTLLIF